MKLCPSLAIAFVLFASCLPAAAQDGKTVAPKKDDVKKPAPPSIYNSKVDADVLIHSALVSAKRENRRVLIQWGADWCPWCHRLFAALKKDQALANVLLHEYDFVMADVGRRDKNMDLALRHGVDLKKNGIPFLTVLDADGKVVVNQPTEPFEKSTKDEKGYDHDKLKSFLTQHQAKAPGRNGPSTKPAAKAVSTK